MTELCGDDPWRDQTCDSSIYLRYFKDEKLSKYRHHLDAVENYDKLQYSACRRQ